MEERHCVAHSGAHNAEVFGEPGTLQGLEAAEVVVFLGSYWWCVWMWPMMMRSTGYPSIAVKLVRMVKGVNCQSTIVYQEIGRAASIALGSCDYS